MEKEYKKKRFSHRGSPFSAKAEGRREKDGTEDMCILAGRRPVYEALQVKQADRLFVSESVRDKGLEDILAIARAQSIPIEMTDEASLGELTDGVRHQGVAARIKPYEYACWETVLDEAKESDPVLLLLDGVEDVRNVGAIVRTAECAGVTAVLLPKHKSAPVTAAAMKTAAGAFFHLPVCRVGNIRQTLEALKSRGFWVVGADMTGERIYTAVDMKGPLVIVMGAEGKGIGSLTAKLCDFLVRIPMRGKVSSLNVSVAAALLVYEAMRQRSL